MMNKYRQHYRREIDWSGIAIAVAACILVAIAFSIGGAR
jgi:hypothetical protein